MVFPGVFIKTLPPQMLNGGFPLNILLNVQWGDADLAMGTFTNPVLACILNTHIPF